MFNSLKKNLNKIALIIYIALFPIISFADPVTSPSVMLNDPLGGQYTSIPALIQKILEGALKIGIPIVALAIIYCGFLFVSARGKPEAITKARDALLYTLIGAAILLGAWAIAKMISATVLAL